MPKDFGYIEVSIIYKGKSYAVRMESEGLLSYETSQLVSRLKKIIQDRESITLKEEDA